MAQEGEGKQGSKEREKSEQGVRIKGKIKIDYIFEFPPCASDCKCICIYYHTASSEAGITSLIS